MYPFLGSYRILNSLLLHDWTLGDRIVSLACYVIAAMIVQPNHCFAI